MPPIIHFNFWELNKSCSVILSILFRYDFFLHGHFGYDEVLSLPIYMVYFYHMYVQFQSNFED